MTYEERNGPIAGQTIAWVGDSNNVLTSWIHAAARLGFALRIATPEQFRPKDAVIAWAKANGAKLGLMRDPHEAVAGASCVTTDCWVSMGDKDDDARIAALRPYQVDGNLMSAAAANAIFMHCLPATRGEEVTDEVMDGPQSAVFDEAETVCTDRRASWPLFSAAEGLSPQVTKNGPRCRPFLLPPRKTGDTA